MRGLPRGGEGKTVLSWIGSDCPVSPVFCPLMERKRRVGVCVCEVYMCEVCMCEVCMYVCSVYVCVDH